VGLGLDGVQNASMKLDVVDSTALLMTLAL
jgi:hypothetical protein